MNRHSAHALLGLTLLLIARGPAVAGSAAPSTDARTTAVQRFILEAPQDRFTRSELLAFEEVVSWHFDSPDDFEGWTIDGAELEVSEGQGLVLWPAQRRLRLTRTVDVEAAAIDRIEFRLRPTRISRVTLEWAGPDESFSPERSVAVAGRDLQPGNLGSAIFWLADSPGWTGRLVRLRFTVLVKAGTPVMPHEIGAAKAVISDEGLAMALSRPWLVEMNSEVRSALLQAPGVPLTRTFVVDERGGRLRFAYGLPESSRQAVRFQVSVASEAASEVLFEDTVGSGASASGRWHSSEIDLSRYASSTITVALETFTTGDLELFNGIPAWAHPALVATPVAAAPLVVVISIDTLRSDRMSLYGHERETTPNIDAWADRSGVVFESAIATAPWTLPSHTSLLTGLDSHRHGVNFRLPASTSLETLADRLYREGFTTIAVTGGGYLSPTFGLAQGFEIFRYGSRQEAEIETGIARALELMNEHRDGPLFLFFHTYEVHTPYRARQPFFRRFSGRRDEPVLKHAWQRRTDPGPPANKAYTVLRREGESGPFLPLEEGDLPIIFDLYDSGVAYMDQLLGKLLARLRQPDMEGRALVVLTSDHGEMLGEHDEFGHSSLFEENLKVPLVVAFPDRRGAGTRVDDQTSLVDVVPTILDTLGLDPPAGVGGRSLIPRADRARTRRIAWSYSTLGKNGLAMRIDNHTKFVFRDSVWPEDLGRDRLYRLDQDPTESRDLASTSSDSARLREQAQRVLREQTSGLRLRISNRGAAAFHGVLAGEILAPTRIKSYDLACPCVDWLSQNSARLEVPPGETFTLLLNVLASDTSRLSASAEGADGWEALFDVAAVDTPTTLVCSKTGCTPGECEAGAGTCLTAWWQGAKVEDVSPAEPDDALRKRLRALGYVD